MTIKTSSNGPGCGVPTTNQYGAKTYLYNEEVNASASPVFSVSDTPVIVNAYNITDDLTHIRLESVFSVDCGPDNRAPYMIACGCQAELNACYSRLVLIEPGQYQFVAEGPMSMVVVTYQSAPLLKELGDNASLANACCTNCCTQDFISLVSAPPDFAPDSLKCELPLATDPETGCVYFYFATDSDGNPIEPVEYKEPGQFALHNYPVYDGDGVQVGVWEELCPYSICGLPGGDGAANFLNTLVGACVDGTDSALSLSFFRNLISYAVTAGDGIIVTETPPDATSGGSYEVALDACSLPDMGPSTPGTKLVACQDGANVLVDPFNEDLCNIPYVGPAPIGARLLACDGATEILIDVPTLEQPPLPPDADVTGGVGIFVDPFDNGDSTTTFIVHSNVCALTVEPATVAHTLAACDGAGNTVSVPAPFTTGVAGIDVDDVTGEITLDLCGLPFTAEMPEGATVVACDGAGNTIRAPIPIGDTTPVVAASPSGGMMPFAGPEGQIPSGWFLCDGSAIDRTANAALYTVIGVTYGTGDGSTTFNLPDLRGRTVRGLDDMGGAAAGVYPGRTVLGAIAGAYQWVMSLAQMPTHMHVIEATNRHSHNVGLSSADYGTVGSRRVADIQNEGQANLQTSEEPEHTHDMFDAGQSGTIESATPFMDMNWIIKA